MIPSILHYCFGMTRDFGGQPWSLAHYVCVKSAVERLKPSKVYFWCEYVPKGPWWRLTEGMVNVVQIKAPRDVFGRPLLHPAHRADVVRLDKLLEYGGIYLDADVFVHRAFDDLLGYRVVMGKQDETGLCNAVILSEPGAAFLRRWHEEYRMFRSKGKDDFWDEHSVRVPLRLATQFADEITTLPASAFFLPSWNDTGVERIFNSVELISTTERYANHLWEHRAWERYLEDLSPGQVRKVDSNFHLWARPMLPALPDTYGAAGVLSRTVKRIRKAAISTRQEVGVLFFAKRAIKRAMSCLYPGGRFARLYRTDRRENHSELASARGTVPVNARAWPKRLKHSMAYVIGSMFRAYLSWAPSPILAKTLWQHVLGPRVSWREFDFVARTAFGSKISGNTADVIQKRIYHFGIWEPRLTEFVKRRLRGGDVFVDVGANIGYFSLLASKIVGKTGGVVAIEPSPTTFHLLTQNLNSNHATNVRAVQLAASDREGTVPLFKGPPDNIGSTSIVPEWADRENCVLHCEVEAKPLGAILHPAEIKRVRLIKIDVEGAESKVISGMLPILSCLPANVEIMIEVTPYALQTEGKSLQDLLDVFAEYGFHPYQFEQQYTVETYLNRRMSRGPMRLREPINERADILLSRQDSEFLE